MSREYKGQVSLIMDNEVVKTKQFYYVKQRRAIIEEWTKEVRRLQRTDKEYFISIILNK